MKKISFFLIVMLTALMGCERHPLYLPEESKVCIIINVNADINTLWNDDWKDSLKYDWDENEYGKIGYTTPNKVIGTFFNNKNVELKQQLEINQRNFIGISAEKIYDILIHNQTRTTHTNYENDTYSIDSYTEKENPNEEYVRVLEPNELFSVYMSNIDFSKEPHDVIYEDKQMYLYYINATLEPISYIYIVQFVFINDDNSDKIEAKGIEGYTISGISSKKDLFTKQPICDNAKEVYSSDVKKGQIHNDSLIFASRITVMDLYKNDATSSWEQNDKYYSIFNVNTYNYGKVSCLANITSQMHKSPKGGIITIYIKNSALKQQNGDTNKFNVTIDDWIEHIYEL